MDSRSAGPGTKDDTLKRRVASGFGLNLAETVQAAERLIFPTPTACAWKGSGSFGSKSHAHDVRKGNLKGVVIEDGNSGQLNPQWVEWLMGFPNGWTDLEDSETQSSPK